MFSDSEIDWTNNVTAYDDRIVIYIYIAYRILVVILCLFLSLDNQPSLVDDEIVRSDFVLFGLKQGTYKKPNNWRIQ